MLAAIGLIWNILKIKHHKVEEKEPLLEPDLPEAIVHQYFTKRRSREVLWYRHVRMHSYTYAVLATFLTIHAQVAIAILLLYVVLY